MSNTTNTAAASGAEDLQDVVSKALRRAWQLGQTYWRQADSDSLADHRRSELTQESFGSLVDETRAALASPAQAVPASVIMASVMRDDGGEHPAFCLMVAYRAEKDAMTALAMLTDEPAQQAAPAPASHPVAAPTQAGEYPAGTGNPEADRIIGRLASSDPDFDDCADAVALIHKLVAEIKGPDGFDTWKDAAIADRAAHRAAQAAPVDAALIEFIEKCGEVCFQRVREGVKGPMRWDIEFIVPGGDREVRGKTLSDAITKAIAARAAQKVK